MKLSNLIHEKALIPALKASTKEEAIREISSLFSDDSEKNSEIFSSLLEREQKGSTLLPGTGLAIPHCRNMGILDFYLGVGISQQGIEEIQPDGSRDKIHVMVVIAAPPMKNELMLSLMASLAESLKTQREWLTSLKKCETRAQLREFFSQVRTPSKLNLSHLIQPVTQVLSPDASLKEAVAMMVENNLFYFPVVDEKGNFLGELTDRDILLFAVPDYILRMDNLLFVVEDEPFGKFLMREAHTTVRDVFNRSALTIEKNAPIIEAAHVMLKNSKRYLYVLDNGKLSGVVNQKDLLRKILYV